MRASFEIAGAIFAYRTEIAWDEGAACLVFHETGRLDAPFAQAGVVSMPNTSGHIYLYTNEQGQMRLAILGRPQIAGEIYGLLTTLAVGGGNQLTPVSVPLALIPWRKIAEPMLGRVVEQDAAYTEYRKHLTAITQAGFARLLG